MTYDKYKINKLGLITTTLIGWWLISQVAFALTFVIHSGSDIVGSLQSTTVIGEQDFEDIGQQFDVGFYELMEANPGVNPYKPGAGTTLTIPTQYILPSGPHKGIVINLAELRLYYFHKDQKLVSTYPIGIGRPEWETPVDSGKITEKTKDPSWHPPDSIRAWYDEHDMYLPDVVPPGPQNPLGQYALRLSIPRYMIHGTNMPNGIGLRSSSGCIRMHPKDIESLFYKVSVGDPVRIVNKPYKIGKRGSMIYAEAHEPLSGSYYNMHNHEEILRQALKEAANIGIIPNKELAKEALKRSNGCPTLIK
jgi:Uncharacterized protein conserved in bacteria